MPRVMTSELGWALRVVVHGSSERERAEKLAGGLGWPGGSGGVEQDQPGLVGGGVFGEVGQDGGVGVGGVVDDDQRSRRQRVLAAGDVGVGFGDGRGGGGEVVGDSGSSACSWVGLHHRRFRLAAVAASCRACRAAVRSSEGAASRTVTAKGSAAVLVRAVAVGRGQVGDGARGDRQGPLWLVAAGGVQDAQLGVEFVELRGDVLGGADFGGGERGGRGEFGAVEVAAQLGCNGGGRRRRRGRLRAMTSAISLSTSSPLMMCSAPPAAAARAASASCKRGLESFGGRDRGQFHGAPAQVEFGRGDVESGSASGWA